MRTLGGYRLGEVLARGGGGTVHRAAAPDGAAVALKLIHGGRVLEEEERRRFEREADALLRLDHPNLVRAREVVWDRGRAGLVMELLAGEDLEARLARGPLQVGEAVRLARDVARGLAHAHARGIVHRDVKPGNVLVTREGRAVLVDFGLARHLASDRSQLTRTGTLHGTPGYWPPEQATGELARIGPASDVYALGATLYALLGGRPPILADTIAAALTAVVEEVPPSLTSLRFEVDPGLDAIVRRCLAKRPEERFPSADALADALEAWEGTRGVVPPVGRGAPPLALAAAILAAGSLGALALLSIRSRDPAGSTDPAGPASSAAVAPAPVASARFAQVDQELLARRFERAEPLLLELFERDPGDLEVVDRLAILHRVAGRSHAKMAALYDRALAARPGSPRLHAGRAVVRFDLGSWREALADAELALAGGPLDPVDRLAALYVRGAARSRLGDAGGIGDLDAVLGLDPGNGLAWFERAGARSLRGDHAGVLEDATVALALGLPPDKRARAFMARGAALVGLGRQLEARVDLEAAIGAVRADDPVLATIREFLPSLPPAPRRTAAQEQEHQAVTRQVQSLGTDHRAALAVVDRALAGPDPHPQLHALRGILLLQLREPAASEQAMARAVELDPGRSEPWAQHAASLHALGRREEVVRTLWRALSIRPEDASCWALLTTTLVELGRTPLAQATATAFVAAAPGDPASWALRGEVRLRAGEPARALEDLDRALGMGQAPIPTVVYLRAQALSALDRRAEAVGGYEQALSLFDPEHPLRAEAQARIDALR